MDRAGKRSNSERKQSARVTHGSPKCRGIESQEPRSGRVEKERKGV